jgi:uncharacterized protein (TIGR02598 family)
MALGVVSFTIVTLMALLSQGLTTFIMSKDLTVKAQIDQQLVTEARQTSFSQLSTLSTSSTPLYFDATGNATTVKANYVYKAVLSVSFETGISVNANLATASDYTTANSAVVTISVTKLTGPSGAGNPNNPLTVSVYIGNNGF